MDTAGLWSLVQIVAVVLGGGGGLLKLVDLWLARGQARATADSAREARLDAATQSLIENLRADLERLEQRAERAETKLVQCEQRAERFLSELSRVRERLMTLERWRPPWDGTTERRAPPDDFEGA